MKEGFRIVRFDDWNRVNDLCALYRTGLGETSKQFWLWKYGSNNGLPDPELWVVEDDRRNMVGTLGIQPYLYRKDGVTLTIVQLQDLVVHPDFRGSGFVRALYEMAMERSIEHGASAFVAYSNDASIGPFIKFGSVDMGDIGSLQSARLRLPLLRQAVQLTEHRGYVYEYSAQMPSDVFFTVCDDAFKMVKSPEYMRWRFDYKPDESFHWLSVRKNEELKAWFVFQENRGRIHTAVNIYDYDLAKDLPSFVLKEAVICLSQRGSWVSLWGRLGAAEQKKWKKAGLVHVTPATSHFLLHFFNSITPLYWHILRVDRDF